MRRSILDQQGLVDWAAGLAKNLSDAMELLQSADRVLRKVPVQGLLGEMQFPAPTIYTIGTSPMDVREARKKVTSVHTHLMSVVRTRGEDLAEHLRHEAAAGPVEQGRTAAHPHTAGEVPEAEETEQTEEEREEEADKRQMSPRSWLRGKVPVEKVPAKRRRPSPGVEGEAAAELAQRRHLKPVLPVRLRSGSAASESFMARLSQSLRKMRD